MFGENFTYSVETAHIGLQQARRAYMRAIEWGMSPTVIAEREEHVSYWLQRLEEAQRLAQLKARSGRPRRRVASWPR